MIKENYDLVLLHPQSLSKKNTIKDVSMLEKKIKNKRTLFIMGNKDKNFEIINKFYKQIKKNKKYSFIKSLPKKKYYSLVKYCDNFYTNTSSVSEIKHLNKSALRIIGIRNKNRSEHIFKSDAPSKLLKILSIDYHKSLE